MRKVKKVSADEDYAGEITRPLSNTSNIMDRIMKFSCVRASLRAGPRAYNSRGNTRQRGQYGERGHFNLLLARIEFKGGHLNKNNMGETHRGTGICCLDVPLSVADAVSICTKATRNKF